MFNEYKKIFVNWSLKSKALFFLESIIYEVLYCITFVQNFLSLEVYNYIFYAFFFAE